ncbi:hypothetical protein CDEST_03774 [Colletotrichum destructivum]|uniref:Uncharacterized protein n=1 Tax=Colletotrichum destructivum TaxID=34406 RepID=A0AAX4I5X8_9PEZI|nr:hypothetical protein CDEST_03774 [Colletotrichum destructivum]
MYATKIIFLLLTVPFASQPGSHALPAEVHKGQPIHVKPPPALAKIFGPKPATYYPQEHTHAGNVAVYNIAHCGKVKC